MAGRSDVGFPMHIIEWSSRQTDCRILKPSRKCFAVSAVDVCRRVLSLIGRICRSEDAQGVKIDATAIQRIFEQVAFLGRLQLEFC